MRTKFTLLVDNYLPSVAPTRDLAAEYSKMYEGRNVQYSPGDLVFVRQGKGNLFELKAKVIKSLQNNSYLLQTDTGLMRKYNQCDLKHRFDATNSTQTRRNHVRCIRCIQKTSMTHWLKMKVRK